MPVLTILPPGFVPNARHSFVGASVQLVSPLSLEAACLSKYGTAAACGAHGAAKKKVARERYDASKKTEKPQKRRSKIEGTKVYGESGGGLEDLQFRSEYT